MLTGEKVRLRELRRDDIDEILRWINDPEVTGYLSMYRPVTRMAEEKWIDEISASDRDIVFIMETLDGEYLGNIGLHSIDHVHQHAEMGIVIGRKDRWGQGYGSDAVRTLLRYGFNTLNLNKVWLRVQAGNQRAIRSYKSCGFVTEGRRRQHVFSDGRFHDEDIMSVLRDQWQEKE